jgi:hypothetical protein
MQLGPTLVIFAVLGKKEISAPSRSPAVGLFVRVEYDTLSLDTYLKEQKHSRINSKCTNIPV